MKFSTWREHTPTVDRVKTLDADVRELAAKFLDRLESLGGRAIVTWGKRTAAEQAALYAQGREPLAAVNALRQAAGMCPLGPVENLRQVSWSRNSPHLSGRAFDIAVLDSAGKADWTAPAYELPGRVGQELGLTWGGSWKKRDLPHFELR